MLAKKTLENLLSSRMQYGTYQYWILYAILSETITLGNIKASFSKNCATQQAIHISVNHLIVALQV